MPPNEPADTSFPRYGLKEEAFVSREAARLSHQSGSRQALWVRCHLLAIEPLTLFIRKCEHRDGNVGWAIVFDYVLRLEPPQTMNVNRNCRANDWVKTSTVRFQAESRPGKQLPASHI
jgi:hypothetical protein